MTKAKKVLITAGGTREYIDDVRVVTNISTGALGAKVAEEFYARGWQVHYLISKQGVMPNPAEGMRETSRLSTYQYVTVEDLMFNMEWIIKDLKVDAVVHSAAVSDFTFDKSGAVKLDSGSPEAFVEFLRKTIRTTPKIIQKVKKWNPDTKLVGFKFTVGKTASELVEIAHASCLRSNCDFVIANDKELMKTARNHVANLIYPSGYQNPLIGKDGIAKGIVEALEGLLPDEED